MFKKILVIFALFITMSFIFIYNNKPVFNNFSESFTVYLDSNSSNAKIITTDKNTYAFIVNKTGESFCKGKGEIKVSDILKEFNAEIVFTENTEYGESVYAYSNKIKYLKIINGKKVNIQIFIGEKNVTVGTPIIFGGY